MGAIYGFSGPPDPALLTKMGETLSHRGPGPVITKQSAASSIGYRTGYNPLPSQFSAGGIHVDKGRVIALAGFLLGDSKPDPARLLDDYSRCGLDFVQSIRGAFVAAITDGKTVHLIRDAAGQRTIYYGTHEGRFYFAVEPKGVLAAPGFPRHIRSGALAQYLTFSFIPGSGTMLQDLHEVPAGHTVTFKPGKEPLLRRYFVFEDTSQSNGAAPEHWVDQFRSTFQAAVEERLARDEPVAVFLSGGLDSSIVTAEVARQHPGKVKTYAIHFGEKYPHELNFARSVAERCGTDHEEFLIRPKQFLPRLRKMIWHLDEPIGDPITTPNFELAAHVSRDFRWAFNGEGGDPIFGGPKNMPMLLQHWYGGLDRAADFREQAYLASYRRGFEEMSRLLTPEWRRQIDIERDLTGVIRPFFEASRPQRFLEKLLAINIRLKGAHLILPKVERMTSAWGLTALSPLFDERLIRLTFQMPGNMKLDRGVEKIVLKRAYENDLPPEVIERPKSGMRVPVHFWFQGEMKRFARKALDRRALLRAGIFDPQRVKQLLDYDIEESQARYGLRLWMLLTFEMWRRIVVEREDI
jgi:asparagine synthase (glutamine-hydrolysing)